MLLSMSPWQIEFEEKLAVTDYKGNEVGHLEVCLWSCKSNNLCIFHKLDENCWLIIAKNYFSTIYHKICESVLDLQYLRVGWVAYLANQVEVLPCNPDGTMISDDDDPFVEDPSELVSYNEDMCGITWSLGWQKYKLFNKNQGSRRTTIKVQ